MNRLSLIVAVLFAVFSAVTAVAGEIMTLNSTARALGMGDAFTAVTDDSTALFYNPASLAKIRGADLKIFSLRAGASGIEAFDTIKDLNGDSSRTQYADAIKKLYGKNVWTGVGGESTFTLPMFGFGIFNHADALVRVDNPVYPQVYTSVINDFGYTAGFGVPLGPFVQAGAALRYVKRTGARVPFGAAFLADLDPDDILDRVTGWGVGYGMDLGLNVNVPSPILSSTLSLAWRNVGQTRYRSGDPNAQIPFDDNDLTAGLSFEINGPLVTVRPAVDVRFLNSGSIQLMRKLNFGVEVDLPLLDVRGGFREGYYTYGLGANLGLFRVDAASYGVELGAYPGQIEDRRYVLEVTLNVDLGLGGLVSGLFSAASGGAKAAEGGRSRGRLKQRR